MIVPPSTSRHALRLAAVLRASGLVLVLGAVAAQAAGTNKPKSAKTPPPAGTTAPAAAAPATTPAPAAKSDSSALKRPAVPAATPATPAPAASPAPTTRVIEAYTDPKPAAPPAAVVATPPPPSSSAPHRLFLGAEVGVAGPLSVLGLGLKAGARVEYRLLPTLPLLASLGIGYERHTASASRIFPGAGGGLDPASLENQNVMPIELGLVFRAWESGTNAVSVGASYGLLPTWTETMALGSVKKEQGVGQQVAIDVGFEKDLGPVDGYLRARWAVRTTDIGFRTGVIELPWYQSVGAVVGIALPL